MENLQAVAVRLFTSVERLRYFALDAFVVCVLFLPALATWAVLGLGFFGVYDFQAKNLKTQRVVMLDSQEFEIAVQERVEREIDDMGLNKKYVRNDK